MANNNNNKNNKGVENFFSDLTSFLNSELGKSALGHNDLQSLRVSGFGNEVDRGRAMADIQGGINAITNFYKAQNLYPELIQLPNNEGVRIVYKTAASENLGLREDQWPSLEIRATKNGATIHNNMWSPEAAMIVRGANGEIGIASALGVGLNRAYQQLQASSFSNMSRTDAIKKMSSVVNRTIRDVTNLSSAVYSPTQIKEFNKLKQQNIRTKRLESTEAMKKQLITADYFNSVFLANVDKFKKHGAPQLQEFVRQMENMTTAARAFNDYKEMERHVMENYAWVYKNIWKGDVENFFKLITGKITQGGMTEGTVGKISVGEPRVPMSILQRVGKKTTQNLQLFDQNSNFYKVEKGIRKKPTIAAGKTVLFTKEQRKMYDELIKSGDLTEESLYKDLYNVAYLTEKNWQNAYNIINKFNQGKGAELSNKEKEAFEKIFGNKKISGQTFKKLQQTALKGFGNDAIFMTEQLADEFKGMEDIKPQKDDMVSYDEANEWIRNVLIKEKQGIVEKGKNKKLKEDKKKKYNEALKELDQLEKGKAAFELTDKGTVQYNFKGAEAILYRYLKRQYDLDSVSRIQSFDINDGKFRNVIATRAKYTENAVLRVGASGDARHIIQKADNRYAALALMLAGYDVNDIFLDPNNPDKGLKIAIIKNANQDFSDKTARTMVMEQTNKVLSYISKNRGQIEKDQGQSINKIFAEFQGTENGMFAKYIKAKADGTFDFDEDSFEKDFANYGKRNKRNHNVTNLMKSIISLGQKVGALDPSKEYYKELEIKGEKYFAQTSPLIGMTEAGISSPSEYGGTGNRSHSEAKVGWKELLSIEGSLGNYDRWLQQHGYTGDQRAQALEPLKNLVENWRDQLRKKEEDYKAYVRNSEYLAKTFTKDATQFQKDMANDESVYILTLEDLKGVYAESMDYNSPTLPGEELGKEAFNVGYDKATGKYNFNSKTRFTILQKKIQETRYKILQRKYAEEIKNNPNYLKEKFGVSSAKDIQTMLSLGDERLIGSANGNNYTTGLVALGLGGYSEEAAKKGIFLPDEIAKQNEAIIASILGIGGANADSQRQKAIYTILNAYDKIEDDMRVGATYDKYHTLQDFHESGYLRLQALSGNAEEIFSDMAKQIIKKRGLASNGNVAKQIQANLSKVQRVMSTVDFKSMAEQLFKTESGRQDLLNLYENVSGKKWNQKVKKNPLINSLIDMLDINSSKYAGAILENGLQLRNPTINFVDDYAGGAMVLSSSHDLVSPGNMMINKYLAEIGKGDMDGDMVAFMWALKSGDLKGANLALSAYYKDLAEQQANIDKTAKENKAQETREKLAKEFGLDSDLVDSYFRFGASKDINGVTNIANRRTTVSSMWGGKKGAGIFGNDAFGIQSMLSQLGLDAGQRGQKGYGAKLLGGSILSAVGQTLYQEGISSKKAGANTLNYISTIQDMANQARTWDNEQTTRTFFDYLINLGIVKSNGAFKDNTLLKVGLKDALQDQETKEEVLQVLRKRLDKIKYQFGGRSKQAKSLSSDIKKIENNVLENVTTETVLGMLEYVNGVIHSLSGDKTIGTYIADLYRGLIPGTRGYNKDIKRLGRVTGNTNYDKTTLDKLTQTSEKKERYTSRIEGINEAKLSEHPGSRVTTRAQRLLVDNKDEKLNKFDSLMQLAKEYGSLGESEKDKQRAEELIKQRQIHYTNIDEMKTVVDALVKGTASHKVAELLGINGNERFEKPEDALEYLKANGLEDYNSYVKQMEFLLPSMTAEERQQELMNAVFRGSRNFNYVANKIIQQKGALVGTEIPLATFTNPENGYTQYGQGTSDIMYVTEDEDADKNLRRILHIGDYKNTAHGELKLENIFQGMLYKQAIQDMMDDVHNKINAGIGGLQATSTFDAYLGTENNVVETLRWRMEQAAAEESGTTDLNSPQFRTAYNKVKEKLSSIYEVVKGDISEIVLEFYSNGADGFLRDYTINDKDEFLQEALTLLNSNQKLSFNDAIKKYAFDKKGYQPSEEYTVLVNRGVKDKQVTFAGTDEQAQQHFKGLHLNLENAFLQRDADQQKLSQTKLEIERLGRELPTPENEQKIKELQEQEKELSKTVGSKAEYDSLPSLEKDIEKLNEDYQKAIKNKSKSEEIRLGAELTELIRKRETIKNSDYGKIINAQNALNNLSILDDEGNEVYSGKEYADRIVNRYSIDEAAITKYEDNLRDSMTRTSIGKHLRDYEKLSKEAAMATAKSKSKLLTDEEKGLAEEEANRAVQIRDIMRRNIFQELKILAEEDKDGDITLDGKKYKLTDILGNKISKEDAEKMGLYKDLGSIDKRNQLKSDKQIALSDQSASLSFETKAFNFYKDQFKRENEIQELDQKIYQAEQENDELKVETLTAEKERLIKINELQAEMAKANFVDMKGYSRKSLEKARKLAELMVFKEEKEQKRIQQAQKQAGGAGGGNVGFLGIDAYAMRWISRMMQGGALAAFIRMIRKGLKDITEKAKQLDQAMTTLRIVTGKNAENARTLINQYADLGKQLGATTIEVTNAASAWLRQGYDISQVNDLIKSSMYLSKLGMIDVSEATKDLTSAMHGFKLEASDAMSIVDKLTALDVKAATTAGDIAQGLAQFANIANLNGVNLDQAAAYVATIADVNQASGTTVGQALKTIMSRYGNVKAGAYNKLNVDSESDDTTEKLNDVERILTKMGISIRKTNLEFKDFDEVMDEIAGKWGTMDNVSKKAIANAFAGIRQQESFLILAENYDKYQKLLDVSENSAGTAEKKYQSYKESYAAAKNEFTAALEQVANSSQISKVLTDLLHMGQGIIEALQRTYPLIPAFIKTLTFIRTVLMGKGVLKSGYEAFMGLTGRNARSKLNDKGSSLGLIGEIKTRRSMNKKIFTLDDINNEKDESKRKKMQKVYDKEQKTKEKEFQKELKYRQQAVAYSRKELEHKKSVLTVSEKEILNKEVVLDKGTMEKLKKEGVVKEGQKTLTYAEAISIVGSGVLQNTKIGKQLEDKILHDRKNGAAAVAYNKIQKEGGIAAPSKAQMGMQKAGAIMNGIEMGIATVATAISQYATAGVTHNYNGKSVESSKEAQKKAGAWASVLSLLPGGSYFAPYVAEWIARNHDAGRDRANSITETANENIGKLNNISSSLENMASSEQGSAERHKLVSEFKKEIFSEDNKELRQLLQHHLGDQSLYTVLNSIDSNTKDSKEALKALQVAQIKAEKAQISGKYASSFFNNKEDLGKIYSRIDNYDGLTAAIVREGLGITAVGNVAGGVAGAGIGAAIGAGIAAGSTTGSAAGPIGTAVGAIVGVIIGTVIGAVGAYNTAEAEKEANRRAHEKWQSFNADQKLNAAQDLLEQEYAAGGQNSQRIQDLTQLINSLKEFKQIESQLIDETNELTLQEAFISSYYTNSRGDKSDLSDMTIEELKNIGNDEILLNYAKAIEEAGGIQGMNVWADESKTKLSTAGYDYLFTKMRQQGDEEINAVLSGEAFSLEEALKLRNKYGADSIQVQKLLRAFADSLNLTTDQLDDVVEDFGKLKLSDTYLSTSAISEKVSNFANLMSSVADGAGQASSWMETIITQFPELIYYMGDTSELFSQTIKRTKQFANEYVNAQYQEVMDNAELFSTIKDELYDSIGGTAAEALRGNKSIKKLSDVMAWAQGQYDTSSGELTEEAQHVMDVMKTMMDNAGMKITSNIMKQYYDQLIDFRSKQIDKELENLESQKEALKDINNQREYENKLVEARLKLEDAEKQKKRVYRAGIGWTYQSDQEAIATAQKELESLKREKQVSELDERITALQGQKTELTEMYDKQNYETLRDLYRAAVKEGDIVENIHSAIAMLKDSVDGLQVPVSKLVDQQLDTDKENKTAAVKEAKLAWNDFIKLNPGSGAYNAALQDFHNKMEVAYANGATEGDFADLDKYQKYNDNRSNIRNAATAWEVFKGGSYDTQKTYVTSEFALKGTDGGTWVATNTGELLTDPSSLDRLEAGLRMGTAVLVFDDGKMVSGSQDSRYLMTDSDKNLTGYFQRLSSLGVSNAYIQAKTPVGNIDAFYNQGNIYRIVGSDGNPYATLVKNGANITPAYNKEVVKNAWGSLGLSKNSMSWINELGTEAIITPQGTLTALPSRTGIVPADITKNLWELGEVAPSLVNILNGKLSPDRIGNSIFDSIANDESFNVDNLVMNVTADSSFDVDKFVSMIKSRVALTKNSR